MSRTRIIFCALQAAAALCSYGEDGLAEEAERLSRTELEDLWLIAGSCWRSDHGLPLGARLTMDKATAFACIQTLEGKLRPLARERRRPRSKMPQRLQNAEPVPVGWA